MRAPHLARALMRIHLIAWDNGVGLSRDIALVHDALAAHGHEVRCTRHGNGKLRKFGRPLKIKARTCWWQLRHGDPARYDLNLMFEHVWDDYLPWARRTALLANPEWCRPRDAARLGNVDFVVAKTLECQRVFAARGCDARLAGFRSEDRLDATVPRERAFFHLAGRSRNKGSAALMALWRRHPQWPMLTVVQSPRVAEPGPPAPNIRHLVGYLSDADLRTLQNRHLFHLCPSETEGYGHYLVEAMGVGAVTLTLDAPPMNELVDARRGVLVDAYADGTQNLGTLYRFAPEAMAAAIERTIALDDAEVARLGTAARAWFEANTATFAARLDAAIGAPALPVVRAA